MLSGLSEGVVKNLGFGFLQKKLKSANFRFLPHCMECRRGLAIGILSVCPSNAWIVTKRKKAVFRFLCHTKEHLS